MSKGPTKAQQALAEARERIEAAKTEVAEREAALNEARKQLEMHETIYAVLEKALTRQSSKTVKEAKKKRSTKSPRATSLQQQIQATKRPALCTYIMTINGNSEPCQGTENDAVHDKDAGYAGYHEFQSAQAVAAAGD